MKNKPRISGPLGFVAVLFVSFAVAASGEKKDENVVITKNEVRIPPEAKVSEADAKALNRVLKTWNKAYYRIDTYSKGKQTATGGTATLDKKMASEFAKDAKLVGLSASTSVIRGMDCSGNMPGDQRAKKESSKSSDEPSPSPTASVCASVKSKVEGILQKYEKK